MLSPDQKKVVYGPTSGKSSMENIQAFRTDSSYSGNTRHKYVIHYKSAGHIQDHYHDRHPHDGQRLVHNSIEHRNYVQICICTVYQSDYNRGCRLYQLHDIP